MFKLTYNKLSHIFIQISITYNGHRPYVWRSRGKHWIVHHNNKEEKCKLLEELQICKQSKKDLLIMLNEKLNLTSNVTHDSILILQSTKQTSDKIANIQTEPGRTRSWQSTWDKELLQEKYDRFRDLNL